MNCQIKQEDFKSVDFSILKGNKIHLNEGKEAIARINALYDWTHDNKEIFYILEDKPTYLFFAKKENELIGYAVFREEGLKNIFMFLGLQQKKKK